MGFPATPQEFYVIRDDRTARCVNSTAYVLKSVRVTADPDYLATYSGQVLLLASCNLLSRWCRTVYLQFPDVALHPVFGCAGSLWSVILDQMLDADPFGRFEVEDSGSARADLRLHVGSHCQSTGESTTVVSCAAWFSAVCRPNRLGLAPEGSTNCVGALFAAAFGSAQVFRDAIGMGGFLPDRFVFDAFLLIAENQTDVRGHVKFGKEPALGRVLMVGAGSVATAAVYCMRFLRLRCDMTIVDGDSIGVENFNRSPVFGKRVYSQNKAQSLADFCGNSTVTARGVGCWWDEFINAIDGAGNTYDLWLPLANNFGVRWKMQNRVPPLMVHGSTTRNWGANFGRHIPGRDDCLAERFSGDSFAPVLKCSSGDVADASGQQVDAALPFLSFLAGALIATDLVRLTLPGYPQVPNFALFDLGGTGLFPQQWDRLAQQGCLCRSQSHLFWKLRREGLYVYLSPKSW